MPGTHGSATGGREITDPVSPLVQAQTLGDFESFSLHIDEPYQAGDYLYYLAGN